MNKVRLIVIFFIVQQINGYGQPVPDSNSQKLKVDTSVANHAHGNITLPVKTYQSILNQLLSANKFINLKKEPVSSIIRKRKFYGKEYLFYLLSSIILIFGLFKIFYSGYFNNIFRVFFNTSLRQNQLTDLLLQARLPSLIFNIVFAITGGLYIWLLLTHYYFANEIYNPRILLFCILTIGVVYSIKFCVLKCVGWVTEMSPALNTYIFVIFLINKIVGITLIPFVIFLAFAPVELLRSAAILSLLVLGVFFIMRFFRSYSLLQHQLSFSRLHFLLYIVSLEIIPLLVVYKLSLKVLGKI